MNAVIDQNTGALLACLSTESLLAGKAESKSGMQQHIRNIGVISGMLQKLCEADGHVSARGYRDLCSQLGMFYGIMAGQMKELARLDGAEDLENYSF